MMFMLLTTEIAVDDAAEAGAGFGEAVGCLFSELVGGFGVMAAGTGARKQPACCTPTRCYYLLSSFSYQMF